MAAPRSNETPGSDGADPPWPERCEVTDPAGVAVLADPRSVRLLAPFLHGTHTLTSAARAVDRPASTMAHWLPRFTAAGLLDELAPVRRAGAPMRRYRAVARTLVVPIPAMTIDQRVALLDTSRYDMLRRFLDGLDEVLELEHVGGLEYRATDDGTPAGLAVTAEETAATRRWYDAWIEVRLSRADAERFAADLEDLVARYRTRRSGRRHVVHLGLAPAPSHRWRSAGPGP